MPGVGAGLVVVIGAGERRRIEGLRAAVLKMLREVLGIARTDHFSCISPQR